MSKNVNIFKAENQMLESHHLMIYKFILSSMKYMFYDNLRQGKGQHHLMMSPPTAQENYLVHIQPSLLHLF